MIKRHLVVLILLMSILFGVDGVNILSATHQRKLVDSLNDRLELGIYEVEFDEPLSIIETYGHCDYSCPSPTGRCPPCDYSDPAICAGSRVNDTSCPCPISEACNLPFLSSNGVALESTVDTDQSKYFAFFIDVESTCNIFLLELFAFNGDLQLSVALASDHILVGEDAFEYYINLRSTQENPDSILLCPEENTAESYLPGTYMVRVSGTEKTWRGTGFSLSLRSTPLPTPLNNASTTCTPATSNHTCLIDDLEYYTYMPWMESNSLYFSLKLPVQCPLPITIFSNHPYVLSLTNPFPDFVNNGSDASTLLLETSARERNVQSLCITQENTFLYMAVPGMLVTPKAEDALSIRISTNPGLFYTRQISDYPAHALPFALSATSLVLTPQERLMCDSFEVYENGCAGYWHLYSGQEVNPLMPSPPRVIKDNTANLQAVTITPLDDKKYAVAVVLAERRLDSYGFRRMTIEDFEAGRMFFTGRLADSQGQPIIMNTTFVPKQLPGCNYRRFNEHHTRITDIMRRLSDFKDELIVNSFRLELNGILAYDSYQACQSFAEQFLVTETTQETTATERCVTSWDDPAFDKDPCCMQASTWFYYAEDGTAVAPNNTCGVQNATFQTPSLVAVSSNAVRDQCVSAQCVENLAERYFQAAARQNHPLIGCDANFINYKTFSDLLYNYTACESLDREDVDGAHIRCILNNTFPSVLDRLAARLNVTLDTTGSPEEVAQQWVTEFQYVTCSFFTTQWTENVKNTTNACQIYSCNWFRYNSQDLPYDTVYEYCIANAISPQFCGECGDSLPYCIRSAEFFDEETCISGTRCKVINGTTIAVADPENDCRNKGFCSLPCNGGDCASERDCSDASVCDDDFFDYTVGKCVDTSLEVQECGQSQYDNDTARVFVGLGCYEPLADETQCLTEVPGGRWVTRTRSEQECLDLNRIYCYTDPETYVTNMTISECTAIGGDWGYMFGWIFHWQTAQWSLGSPITLQWLNRSVDLAYGEAKLAWDTDRLLLNTPNVIADLYSIEQSAAAKCRAGQASELINAIACSCASDGERSNACFEQYNPTTALTQQVICRGVQNYIFLQQADVVIEPNDVLMQSSICTLVQNSIVGASEFEVMTNNELSNFFLRFARDTYRIVQNANNATIGKIVSDGLAFDFNADAEILRARICMEGDVTAVDLAKFGVADVGLADWSTKSITPMSLPVIWNGTHLCAYVYNITDSDAELNTNIYFFIQRVENWQEQLPQMEFTQAELGLIISLIICYTFTLGFSGYRIIEMIRYGYVAQIKILIYCFLAGLFLVRLLYFLLLVGNVFAIESRGDYVLIELPSFLYFSTLSVYVIVWAVSLRSALDMGNDTKRLLQRATLIVNGSIYLIFILLIILYETLRPAPVVECNGLLVTNDLTTSSGIALAYRLFVTSISFALMLCFAIYGIKATRLMGRNSQIKSKNTAKNKTMQTTAISASGLLVQCIYFLLLLVVNFQNNILSLAVLFVVEIGVGVTLLVLTDVRKKISSTSGTRMQSRTGGSSTNSSGTNHSSKL